MSEESKGVKHNSELLQKDKLYDGFVVYTDGSSDAQGGYIGWAAHGYFYTKEAPKRAFSHPKVIPTVNGYQLKTDAKDECVTVHGFVDIVGSTQKKGTNNTAEANGLLSALKFAKDYRVNKIMIRPDAEYVINGCTKWMSGWAGNNWKKRTGEPVANAEVWRDIMGNYSTIVDADTKVTFKWVKGHSGEFGNTTADKLASVARQRSKQGHEGDAIVIKEIEGVTKPSAKKNNLIFYPGILFKTVKENNPKGLIFTNMTKVEEMVGRNDTDAVVVYAELGQTDPVIDIIIEEQTKQADEIESIVMLNYRRLYTGDRASDILEHKGNVLRRSIGHRHDMYFHDDDSFKNILKKRKPITQDLVPPMLIERTWLAGYVLRDNVEFSKQYLENPQSLIKGGDIFDITDIIFEKIDKPKDDHYALKPILKNNTREFSVRLLCRGAEADYKLVVGLHIPPYLVCKSFTKFKDIKVFMILRHISPEAERYSLVFKVGDNWIGMSAYSANLLIHTNPLVQ